MTYKQTCIKLQKFASQPQVPARPAQVPHRDDTITSSQSFSSETVAE